MDLWLALVTDVVLLLASLYCVLQFTDRSTFNPSLWYIALHVYSVTSRLIMLNLGGQSFAVIGIRSDMELVNAAIASDLSLIGIVVATILAARKKTSEGAANGFGGNTRTRLSPELGTVISALCLTIGTFALIKYGAAGRSSGIDISTIDIGKLEESSYPVVIGGFAVQGALIQCAMHGFSRWRMALLAALLFVSSFNARTAFVLASVMAFLIHQTRRKQHSMPMGGIIGFVLLGLVWFVYKPVGAAILAGENPAEIWDTAHDYLDNAVNSKSSIDTQFLDMQATYMAAADEAGARFYGSTVLPLIYLPIPRFLWPEKPHVNDYALGLSSSSRLITQCGMIPLLSGESYLNFGWVGCVAIPFLYMLGMQTAYQRVRSHGITSPARWIYMVYLIAMIQVYRDGLLSLILFPLIGYLPLISWGVISMLLPRTVFRGEVHAHILQQQQTGSSLLPLAH